VLRYGSRWTAPIEQGPKLINQRYQSKISIKDINQRYQSKISIKDINQRYQSKISIKDINCLNMPNSLYWDGKSDPSTPGGNDKAAQRSESAGCGPNNRCSRPPYSGFADEYGCSQFPFVSCLPVTEEGYPSINRCVPEAQSDGMCILIPQCQ
jgi:hypothetical protein